MGKLTDFFVNEKDVVRLEFDDDSPLHGEWLEVRKELSGAEESALQWGTFKGVEEGDSGRPIYNVNATRVEVDFMLSWLVNWSLVNKNGVSTKPKRHEIEQMRPIVSQLILRRIEQYVTDLKREQELSLDPKPAGPEGPSGSGPTTTESESTRTATSTDAQPGSNGSSGHTEDSTEPATG